MHDNDNVDSMGDCKNRSVSNSRRTRNMMRAEIANEADTSFICRGNNVDLILLEFTQAALHHRNLLHSLKF